MDDNTKFLLTLAAGALGGAVVAGIFAMINGHVTHKREQRQWLRNDNQEHEKWKRERKYEAYQLIFYEISRILMWTQEVMQTGTTDSTTNRDEAESIWRFAAAVNMHLPEELGPDFAIVNKFLSDLSVWGRAAVAGTPNPERYQEIHSTENQDALNRVKAGLLRDLKL